MTNHSTIELLKKLFREATGTIPEFAGVMDTASGSRRKYYRLSNSQFSYVGVYNNNVAENEAFFYLTNHFLAHALPVPEITAICSDRKCYLQQDLGDISLYDILKSGNDVNREEWLKQSLEHLVVFQVKAMSGLNFGKCYPRKDFDRQAGLWDLNYFKYMFLKPALSEIDEDLLEKDFGKILDFSFDDYHAGFMYRDFQSRNIMMHHSGLWFIDYQGGRLGPMAYDPASLLYQTRIALPDDLRQRLVHYYCNLLNDYMPLDTERLELKIRSFAVLRLLQTLGAYGFRGLFERKEAFIKPLYPAIVNTLHVIDSMPHRQKPEYIAGLLQEVLPGFSRKNHENKHLTVTINSFSYMHGLPEDNSGNGGGFIFDCRGLPNPHNEPELRKYSGTEKVIVDWFVNKPEVSEFLNDCERLVKKTIDNYQQRGFTNLQVNFGCTGGKHRSVYCAEMLCSKLKEQYSNIVFETDHRQLVNN